MYHSAETFQKDQNCWFNCKESGIINKNEKEKENYEKEFEENKEMIQNIFQIMGYFANQQFN